MKKLIALTVLALGLLLVYASKSDATTTFANGTAGTGNSGQAYTPVVSTSTTETESAPTSSTAGIALSANQIKNKLNTVVTVKAHVIVNVSGDAGIYDMTDASTGYALNTFGPSAKLYMWVLDSANGNTTWSRYSAGDVTLPVGESAATAFIKVAELPQVNRIALIPYKTNVPTKVTYSDR